MGKPVIPAYDTSDSGDLTADIAREREITLDMAGFESGDVAAARAGAGRRQIQGEPGVEYKGDKTRFTVRATRRRRQ